MAKIIATRWSSELGKCIDFKKHDVVVLPNGEIGVVYGFEPDRQSLVIEVVEGELGHFEYVIPELVSKVHPSVAKIWRKANHEPVPSIKYE